MAKEKSITLELKPGKTACLSNFQLHGQNKLRLTLILRELGITLEHVVDMGDLKAFLQSNPSKTWRDWMKPYLLNIYDSYAWTKQVKEVLEGEALKAIRDALRGPGSPWSITATASGDNVVKTPGSGQKLRIKLVDVWNNGSADITVYLRFASGTARFKKTLAAKTGFIVNLLGANWEGGADEALKVNLSATGAVDVTVLGEEF